MKLNVNGYEIEIKAKAPWNERCSKADTLAVLLEVAIMASETRNRYEEMGLYALAEKSKLTADSLHDVLEAAGYFEN